MSRNAKGVVFALVATAMLLGILAAALAEEQQPEIVIPKMRHDFGSVYEQETYEYHFVVRNKGKADLVIDDVKPG
jgi:hypothetical protein